jgi:hypothetical protein
MTNESMVRLSKPVKIKLKAIKIYKRESYEEIIVRLLEERLKKWVK